MICLGCNCPDTHVISTKHDDDKNLVERRRECLHCGKRFTTHEKLKDKKKKDKVD